VKSWINRTFRHILSEKKIQEYARNPASVARARVLLASLKIGDRTHFRSTLGALVPELGELGVIASDLGVIASQRAEAVIWLTEIVCTQDEDEVLRRVASYALIRVGTGAMPALREAWDREQSLLVRGRLHLCSQLYPSKVLPSAKRASRIRRATVRSRRASACAPSSRSRKCR
jgi:hypothetical protein